MPTVTVKTIENEEEHSEAEDDLEAYLKNLPESDIDYPQDYLDMLDKQFKLAEKQIESGELVPQTVDELAAELGIERV
jgi:hypothetical protein